MKPGFHLLLIIWLTCILSDSYGQKNFTGYIVKDSTYSTGKVIQLSKEKIQFQRNTREQSVIYDAHDIKEYGYDGKVYESLLINGSQKFSEKIAAGKIALYRNKNLYAIKIDTALVVFSKGNFRSVINKYVKCEGGDESLLRLSYSKASLSNYIKDFNSNKCNPASFPYRKFGGYLGYNFFQFNSALRSLELNGNATVPALGFFIDIPLYEPQRVFITTELNWFHGEPLLYKETQTTTNYSGLNVSGFNLLVSGKWFFSQKGVSPYFKTGLLLSHMKITSPTGLIETISNGMVVEIFRYEILKSSTVSYGFNSGIGLEIPYQKRKKFHLEFKYVKTFSEIPTSMDMNFSGLLIFGGFNI